MRLLVVLVGTAVAFGCAHRSPSEQPPLQVVPVVDLDRYLGTWYEIASYPQRFQRDCVASRATYSRLEGGRIRVENTCRDKTLDGRIRRAVGVAWVVDGEPSNAKLKVQFFWPFRGDYWIIVLDSKYEYAVVGHPSREYLWILSRAPQMNETLYQDLLRRVAGHGYDLDRIRRTPQERS